MSLETKIRDAFERHANDARPGTDVWKGVERRIRRSHRIRLAGSGIAVAALVAAIAVAVPRLTTTRSLEPDAPTSAPGDVPVLSAKIPLNAVAIASGRDALWAVTDAGEVYLPGTLSRIDPGTNRVTGNVRIGVNPLAVAFGDGSVWVLHGEGCGSPEECQRMRDAREPSPQEVNSLWRIDPRSLEIKDTINVGPASDMTIAGGYGWTVGAEYGLQRVDLRPDVMSPISVFGSVAGAGRTHLAIGGGYAWITSEVSETPGKAFLSIIDLKRGALEEILDIIPSGTEPDVAFGFGSAWIVSSSESSASGLMRVDPATRRVIAHVTLQDAAPVGLTSVTTGYGYVWATSARGHLWKVDPITNSAPIDPILIGDTPPAYANAVVTGFGSVWVSGEGQIWRFDP